MLSALQLLPLLLLLTVLVNIGCATQFKSVAGVSRLGYSIQVGAFSEVKNAERLTIQAPGEGDRGILFPQG